MSDVVEKELASYKDLSSYDAYPENVINLGPAKELLRTYANIPADQVDAHIAATRAKLWAVGPFPCIGHYAHLAFTFLENPAYHEALARLRAPGSADALLDLACMVGQVVRHLAHAGVDPARLYGADLRRGYLEVGYELWNDRGRTRATFVAGDLLAGGEEEEEEEEDPLAVLDGRVTLVHMQNFFHLFSWDEQVRGARRIVRFLRPDGDPAGQMVFGEQVGTVEPGERPLPGTESRAVMRYIHDGESWQRLWDEVGRQTGTRWQAESGLTHMPDYFMKWEAAWPKSETMRRMRFAVRRVA